MSCAGAFGQRNAQVIKTSFPHLLAGEEGQKRIEAIIPPGRFALPNDGSLFCVAFNKLSDCFAAMLCRQSVWCRRQIFLRNRGYWDSACRIQERDILLSAFVGFE